MPEKKPTDRVAINIYTTRKLRMEFRHASDRLGMTMQENFLELMLKFIEYEKEQK